MTDVYHRNDQCRIVVFSSLADSHIEVLKQGDTFGLFDQYGDIHSLSRNSQGLYMAAVLGYRETARRVLREADRLRAQFK